MYIKRWDQFTTVLRFRDHNKQPVNITWATLFFTVRPEKKPTETTDTIVSIQKNITAHTNATEWLSSLFLSKSDTNLTPWIYYWEIQIKLSWWSILSTRTWVLEILHDLTKRTT